MGSRKFRQVDDGNGLVSYDELQKVIFMTTHDLLYIFDIFAKQNELVDAKELLTMVCIFSSATIQEKGRFLMALFDATKTGTCTAAEIAQICQCVCAVLGKCTGNVVKPKEVTKALKAEIPEILPNQFAEAAKEYGSDKAFTEARLISQNELDMLLPSIKDSYEDCPLSGLAPADSVPPPPPDWSQASNEAPKPAAGPGVKGARSLGGTSKGGQFMKASTKKVTESELAHLVWMTRLDEDVDDKESLRQLAAQATGGLHEASKKSSATRWMLLHGQDFAAIAKDLVSFRRNFQKGISAAIGVASTCVVVENITKGCIQFSLVGDLARDGETLMGLVESQLNNSHSALRRGPFASYVDGAELVATDIFGDAADAAPPTLPEVQAELAKANRRIAEMEKFHEDAFEELKTRDFEIARLKQELGDNPKEDPRDAEIARLRQLLAAKTEECDRMSAKR